MAHSRFPYTCFVYFVFITWKLSIDAEVIQETCQVYQPQCGSVKVYFLWVCSTGGTQNLKILNTLSLSSVTRTTEFLVAVASMKTNDAFKVGFIFTCAVYIFSHWHGNYSAKIMAKWPIAQWANHSVHTMSICCTAIGSVVCHVQNYQCCLWGTLFTFVVNYVFRGKLILHTWN